MNCIFLYQPICDAGLALALTENGPYVLCGLFMVIPVFIGWLCYVFLNPFGRRRYSSTPKLYHAPELAWDEKMGVYGESISLNDGYNQEYEYNGRKVIGMEAVRRRPGSMSTKMIFAVKHATGYKYYGSWADVESALK